MYNVDYSLLGTARVEPLIRRIRNDMREAGMRVETSKGGNVFASEPETDRPVIGLTASEETVRSGTWVDDAVVVPQAYVRAVQSAGARAVVLVPDPQDAARPDPVLDALDGLIVTGAAGDVDPGCYGEPKHAATHPVRGARDPFEIALVRAAVERDVPLLGVCRGCQLLNVAYSGTLEQHLPEALGHGRHQGPQGQYAEHEVRLEPGSLVARAVGAERTRAKSFHHQGVQRLGQGLRVTGWSAEDDLVEAIEDPARPFVLGVLWHPEEDERSLVISALVAAAERGASSSEAA